MGLKDHSSTVQQVCVRLEKSWTGDDTSDAMGGSIGGDDNSVPRVVASMSLDERLENDCFTAEV